MENSSTDMQTMSGDFVFPLFLRLCSDFGCSCGEHENQKLITLVPLLPRLPPVVVRSQQDHADHISTDQAQSSSTHLRRPQKCPCLRTILVPQPGLSILPCRYRLIISLCIWDQLLVIDMCPTDLTNKRTAGSSVPQVTSPPVEHVP